MELAFFGTFAVLFLVACLIGVVALYLALKNWAWEQLDIELPPKTKPEESYWRTLEYSVIPYECGECRYLSDKKFCYCPNCGKKMENHEE